MAHLCVAHASLLIGSIILSVILSALLYISIRSNEQTTKQLKKSFIAYLSFALLRWISQISIASRNQIIGNDNQCNHISFPPNKQIVYILSIYIWNISFILSFVLIGYFLKMVIQNNYRHRFFAFNHSYINIGFLIHVISAIIGNIIIVTIKTTTAYLIGNIQWLMIAAMYYILIMILSNKKLAKFVSLSNNNDQFLSESINTAFSNLITKQTNLISVIAVITCLFEIFILCVNVLEISQDNNHETLLHSITIWMDFIADTMLIICLYLTYSTNYNRYMCLCKYCHHCCGDIRKSLWSHSHTLSSHEESTVSLMANYNTYKTVKLQIFDIDSVCSKDQCKIIDNICKLLDLYQQFGQNITKHTNESATTIQDNFNHMLLYHNAKEDIQSIYNKVNKDEHNDQKHHECAIYWRHNARRNTSRLSKNKQKYQKTDEHESVMFSILDRIHTFYCHSDDLNDCTSEPLQTTETPLKSSISQQVKKNKFNSNLQISGDSNNIFSFGQRFEYEEEKHELHCKPKYNSLKDELVNNTICNIDIYDYDEEYNKCKLCMMSRRLRRIKQRNIQKQLLFDHIFVLLIYCNCDQYQNEWSASFRRIPSNESDESLVARHSHFYQCSKYLRDLVEWFGSRLIDENNKNITFYHGVSKILYFHKTITQFKCPLSTSTEINVALRFSNNIGIILALKYSFSTYPLNARYFNCLYFSDYPNEKECLFIGGIPMMIITNIINVSNNYENYEKYVNAINIINCILNGTYSKNSNNYTPNQESINLCSDLLSLRLEYSENHNNTKYPQYVTNLLSEYCMNLANITIFWHFIENFKPLNELFCIDDNLLFFDFSVLLKIFPNITQIEYFNQSLFEGNTASKEIIRNIVTYIFQCQHHINKSKIQYIIIHHHVNTLNYNVEQNEWDLYQDQLKIIIHRKSLDKILDLNSINIHFNQITQGNITQNMLNRVLSITNSNQ